MPPLCPSAAQSAAQQPVVHHTRAFFSGQNQTLTCSLEGGIDGVDASASRLGPHTETIPPLPRIVASPPSPPLPPVRPTTISSELTRAAALLRPPLERGTSSQRRAVMAVRTVGRQSYKPLVCLLSASVGRSLVAISSSLLVDGAHDQHTPPPGPQASFNATLAAWALQTAHGAGLLDLSVCASEAGVIVCIQQLTRALASLEAMPATRRQWDSAAIAVQATAVQSNNPHANARVREFVLAGAFMGVGGLFFVGAATAFARDTRRIDKVRATKVALVSALGFVLVVVSDGLTEFAVSTSSAKLHNLMILPRALGTFLIFASIPLSFTTCELVNGDSHLPHRETVRQLLTSLGPTMMLIWGSLLSNPSVPAAVHELLLGMALTCIILANALSQTTVARLRAVLAAPEITGMPLHPGVT